VLHDRARHEPIRPIDWDEDRVLATIEQIVNDTELRFSPDRYWPVHARDLDGDDDPNRCATSLYYGACGVMWALHYLQAAGAAQLSRSYTGYFQDVLIKNRAWLSSFGRDESASYMMGDTPILMLAYGHNPGAELADRLATLIAGNLDNPTRELMWGSPGTLLASLFLHDHTGDERWAELFRRTAAKLWSQLQWSPEYACHYWTQTLYGQQSSYLDAVHGFVATASPIIRGRHLLDAGAWTGWKSCIANTIERNATWDGARASWRTHLYTAQGRQPRMLMQFCHGAPGFVVCLAGFPGTALDALLTAAGEAVWAAGPLTKGSNLCHGTGGNGYAFLKLFQRTGQPHWLDRARAFAMHGIAQTEADAQRYNRLRYSLWTGDPGFAIYLWDCVIGKAAFPTLDVFFSERAVEPPP
jgi:hypothetical protein